MSSGRGVWREGCLVGGCLEGGVSSGRGVWREGV